MSEPAGTVEPVDATRPRLHTTVTIWGSWLGRRAAYGPSSLSVVLLVIALVVTSVSDLSQLTVALTYGLAATGLGFALGLGGEYILAQGSLFACSAYVTAALVTNHAWNYWLAGLAGIGAAILLGLVLSVPGLRVSRFYLAMVGFFLIDLTPDILQVFSKETGGSDGLSLQAAPSLFGISLDVRGMFVLAAVALVVGTVLTDHVRRSPFGVHIRRMRDDPFVLGASGVAMWRIRIGAYVLCSLLGGLGGAVYSEINGYLAPYDFDITFTILLFAAVVVGGETALMGPVLGVVILYVVPQIIINVPGVSDLIYGSTVVLSVVLLREGVQPAVAHAWRTYRWRVAGFRSGVADAADDTDHREPAGSWSGSSLSAAVGPLRSGARSAEAVLAIRGAHKAYGGNAALDMDSAGGLTVVPGEVHLLVGPNGSGKTTLLNALTGLARLDRGQVTLAGVDVTRASSVRIARLGLSRSYQMPRLPAELTPCELLAASMARLKPIHAAHWVLNDWVARRARRVANDAAMHVLSAAGLSDVANAQNRALTSGHRRVLDVLMALCSHATIVLLDEPAAGLSKDERQGLAETITELAKQGIGFLVVEHDLELGFAMADTVTVLAGGQIICQGLPGVVREDPIVRRALMGGDR